MPTATLPQTLPADLTATLAQHLPERVYQTYVLADVGRDIVTNEPTRAFRCACGWSCDVPEYLTAKRWAEHVSERLGL